MRLKAKMIGVAIYAVFATAAVFTSNHMMAKADAPMAGESSTFCPKGHMKG